MRAIFAACGAWAAFAISCAPPAPPAVRAPVEHEHVDICKGSPPVPHPYEGILRVAECDQDMYAIMASVGDQLGVACSACHAPLAADPSKQDFPAPTPRKEIANWMSAHLMTAIKTVDGSPMRCRSCHTDALGQPVLKILGEPRDPVKVNEWMSLVMVRNFVAADGSKLKCKSCHGGSPGTPGFRATVIGKSEQLPAHVAGGKGTRAY